MKIDLSCPVELWHFRMPTAAYPVVSLHMFNLSEKAVVSIQAAFLSFDEEGEEGLLKTAAPGRPAQRL